MNYSEITASSLVKIDIRGEVIDPGATTLGVNQAGFTLHSAIHQFRPDIKCIIHLHTPSVVAVSIVGVICIIPPFFWLIVRNISPWHCYEISCLVFQHVSFFLKSQLIIKMLVSCFCSHDTIQSAVVLSVRGIKLPPLHKSVASLHKYDTIEIEKECRYVKVFSIVVSETCCTLNIYS